MKPVLFVTGHAPFDRIGAFAALHQLEGIEVALFGGRSKHGGPMLDEALPFPHRHVAQHELFRLAASGKHRAVVCSAGGRVALPATWAGARMAGVPLILWTSLWAHPRSPVHTLSLLALKRLYRSADAVVTYGSHVSAYVRSQGARNVHVAPQPVDNAFWGSSEVNPPSDPSWPAGAQTRFLFAGRPTREKGLRVLIEAWRKSSLCAPTAALVLAGGGSRPPWVPAGGAAVEDLGSTLPSGVLSLDPVDPVELRNLYAASNVLVLPSIQTRTFREPWGLVINEAMNQRLPVIVSDAVGAAAGGLVQDGRNGLVVPAGDSTALASALERLAADPQLCMRMGEAGAEDVRAYDYIAWAEGFSRALDTLGLARRRW